MSNARTISPTTPMPNSFPVRFEKFGVESLAGYMATEAPATEEIRDKEIRARLSNVLRARRCDIENQSQSRRCSLRRAVLVVCQTTFHVRYGKCCTSALPKASAVYGLGNMTRGS